MMKGRKKKPQRKWLILCMLLMTAGGSIGGLQLLLGTIPDEIQISEAGEIPSLLPSVLASVITCREVGANQTVLSEKSVCSAALSSEADESVSEKKREPSKLSYELFGKIPLKTVNVNVAPRQNVYIGGMPIGIYLETAGVYVVETGEIISSSGKCCPAEHIIQSGDYIQSVNGEKVATKEELIACIGKCQGEKLALDVERSGEQIQVQIQPVLDKDGTYRAGIWVRNDTQGIGTLTYIDESGNFGALGHGISDIDTGELLNISGGVLYDAEVISVIKGTQGTPGELAGIIHYSSGYQIGSIAQNSQNGLYGTVVSMPKLTENMTMAETAYRQEVKEGPASIWCTVNGSCSEYDVEIKEVRLNGKDVNKGMIIEVTDSELLELTGGIVQGMSGSPILQDGKIVGAVTHVLVNDPTRGYGIFIESMMEAE